LSCLLASGGRINYLVPQAVAEHEAVTRLVSVQAVAAWWRLGQPNEVIISGGAPLALWRSPFRRMLPKIDTRDLE
jgi:hypothetical protein